MATQQDKTSTGLLATIVVVGAFAMIAISAWVTALVRSERAKLDELRPNQADLETVAALDRAQLDGLTAPPRWVDREKGKLAIPIGLAMSRVLEEYRAKPEAASPPPPPGMVMNPVAPAPVEGGAAVPPGAVSPGAVSPGAVSPGAVSPGAVSPGAVPPEGALPGGVRAAAPASPAGAAPSGGVPSGTVPAAPSGAVPAGSVAP
jgi:hypothetical protein